MLQDDQTMATEIVNMARTHFNKLASLSVKVQGAKELGAIAAHSNLGADLLEKQAYDQNDLEKLASQILNNDLVWNDLSEMEKVAIFGQLGRGLGKAFSFMTKGRNVNLPKTVSTRRFGKQAPRPPTELKTPDSPAVQKVRQEASAMREGTPRISPRTTQPGQPPPMVTGARPNAPPTVAGAKPNTPRGGAPPGTEERLRQARVREQQAAFKRLNPDADVPTSTPRTPDTPGSTPTPDATKKPKWWNWKKQLAVGAGLGGATYLGGKALDTTTAFLTPQPPGTAYQYGAGSPSHFKNPQMGW